MAGIKAEAMLGHSARWLAGTGRSGRNCKIGADLAVRASASDYLLACGMPFPELWR
jgi:hypothetical protein